MVGYRSRHGTEWRRRGGVLLLLAALPLGLLHTAVVQPSSSAQPAGDRQECLDTLSDFATLGVVPKPKTVENGPPASSARLQCLRVLLQGPEFWYLEYAPAGIPSCSSALFITVTSSSFF